jgi:hypothetical protein
MSTTSFAASDACRAACAVAWLSPVVMVVLLVVVLPPGLIPMPLHPLIMWCLWVYVLLIAPVLLRHADLETTSSLADFRVSWYCMALWMPAAVIVAWNPTHVPLRWVGFAVTLTQGTTTFWALQYDRFRTERLQARMANQRLLGYHSADL